MVKLYVLESTFQLDLSSNTVFVKIIYLKMSHFLGDTKAES